MHKYSDSMRIERRNNRTEIIYRIERSLFLIICKLDLDSLSFVLLHCLRVEMKGKSECTTRKQTEGFSNCFGREICLLCSGFLIGEKFLPRNFCERINCQTILAEGETKIAFAIRVSKTTKMPSSTLLLASMKCYCESVW